MAARSSNEFDYEKVKEAYDSMIKIIGSAGEDGTLVGILDKLDKEYKKVVNIEDGAIYGSLGDVLLLDWNNTSSNFPNFISNFNNWSALVADTSKQYSEFEARVKEFKNVNPYGATSGGITASFVKTDEYYSNSLSSEEIQQFKDAAQFYSLTGAGYIDTGMTSALVRSDIFEGIELAFDAIAIYTGVKAVKSTISAVNTLRSYANGSEVVSGVKGAGNILKTNALKQGQIFANNSKFLNFLNKTKVGSKLATKLTPLFQEAGSAKYILNLNPASYNGAQPIIMQEISNAAAGAAKYAPISAAAYVAAFGFGTQVRINETDYTYFAQASNGTNIVADADGNLLYQGADGTVSPVTGMSNGSTVPLTYDNIEEDTVLIVNGNPIGTIDDLKFTMYTGIRDYNEDLSNNVLEFQGSNS